MKCRLKYLETCLNASVEVAKEKYCHNTVNKLMNTQKNSKVYWPLLKILLNNNKIPIIRPLFYENRFVTDFKEKDELFNIFFSKQCSLIPNNSCIVSDINYITDKRLSSVTFLGKDVGKIIQNLGSNKTHGYDNLSVCMLKICSDSFFVSLSKQAHLTGVFSSEWIKEIIVPIHKKGDKQIIKNYRPVSILPICGKIFEKLIFNKMFIYFSANKLSKN